VVSTQEKSPEELWARAEIKELVKEKINTFKEGLSFKEKDILELRLLADKPLTLKAIGKKHGVSRERVRQIEVRLLKKLHNYLQREFPDYKEAIIPNF
jgi:RNA polymerase sigma-32 factor